MDDYSRQQGFDLWIPSDNFLPILDGAEDIPFKFALEMNVSTTDGDGIPIIYIATLRRWSRISEAVAREVDAPHAGMRLFQIDEDYSTWEKHERIRSRLIGYRKQHQDMTQRPIHSYTLPAGEELDLVLLRRHVRVEGVRPFGEIRWRSNGDALVSIRNLDLDQGKPDSLPPLWAALRDTSRLKRPKRGPKIGTVKKQKYKSIEEWHAAVLATVRSKPIQTQVATQINGILAGRLDMSDTTVRRNLSAWGPSTPEEILNGKFNCECHSCFP